LSDCEFRPALTIICIGPSRHAMWNAHRIVHLSRLAGLCLRQTSCVQTLVTILALVAVAGPATADEAMVGRAAVSSNVASANSANDRAPKKPRAVSRLFAGNPLWGVRIKDLAATRNRPLFSPSRRPPAPVVTAAPPPPPPRQFTPEKPPLVLIGTVVSENEAIAVFRDQSTKRTVKLRTGLRLDGWALLRVNKKDVVLRKENTTVSLALSADAVPRITVAMQEHEPRLVRRQR
jgi:hypothetical protein